MRPSRSGVAALITLALAVPLVTAPRAGDGALSVRITSPLGRTGVQGTVRIVAQVRARPEAVLSGVQFYVDSQLLGTVSDGPPYAVEWVDDNPFQARDILVQLTDQLGNVAQDRVHLDPFEIAETTEVNSVLLEASVQDRKGRFIIGLGAPNFELKENGVPQTPQVVRQEAVPATFALLVDRSQSMQRRMDFVRNAAARLVGSLRPHDRVMVAPFSKELDAVTGPTDDHATILEAIEAIRPAGGTSILDSLVEVTKRLPGRDTGRRVVILVTDGYDENSQTSAADTLTAVKASGVTTYTIGIGGVAGISLQGERLMKRLAAETGGQAFFPPRETDLNVVYDKLATDAQNRYLITYTPRNQKADGSWRAVSLATTPESYVVRTRDGYQAPKPPPIRPTLEFTVTGRDESYVSVTADDVDVLEDGVPQKVDTFQEAVTPVSIILALDASGSMKKSADAVVQAASEFVSAVRPQDSLAVVLFSDKSLFAHDFSKNRESTNEAIKGYQAAGGTALYDALKDSLIHLRHVEGRRVVVVVTDGRDENSTSTGPGSSATLDQVTDLIRQTGSVVYSIGLGGHVDRAPLERIAKLSGGQSYFPMEVSSLAGDYRHVVENLRRRFALSYTSSNSTRDGSWRSVSIRPRSESVAINSPSGYFAPEK